MKYKILLGLGSLATIVAPISTIIACGKDAKIKKTPVKTNQQFVDEAKEAFVNASSSKDKAALVASIGSKVAADVVTIAELGYTAPTLEEGVSVTYAIKTTYDATSKKVVIIATITKEGARATQELEITAMTDAAVANAAVQALTNADLNVTANDQQLPSAFVGTSSNRGNILAAIQGTITNNEEAKTLIEEEDIALGYDDIAGTITVAIFDHGNSKELTISGFKRISVNLATEIVKLQNFTTVDVASAELQALEVGDTNVKDQFMAISDYASANKLYTSALTNGVTIDEVVVQTKFVANTRTIVFKITLAKVGAIVANHIKENIIVTFNYSKVELQRLANEAIQALTNKGLKANATQLPSELVATSPIPDIVSSIQATISNEAVKALILAENITLAHNDIAGTITLTITGYGQDKVLTISGFKQAPVSLVKEIVKLQDFTTTDAANVVDGHDLTTLGKSDIDVKDKFALIANLPSFNLTDGVAIDEVVIKTAYNSTTRTIVFKIILAKVGVIVENNTKEITVTFAKTLQDLAIIAVQALEITSNLGIAVTNQQSPSAFVAIPENKTSILAAIKAAMTTVDPKVQALILEKHITLTPNDVAGTITVTIIGHGVDKELQVISGFQQSVDLTTETHKLQDFTTTDAADSDDNNLLVLLANDSNVKDEFIAISGSNTKLYVSGTKNLANDVAIVQVVIKTAYNSTTRKIVFEITLAKGDAAVANDTKEITVTFNYSNAELRGFVTTVVQGLTTASDLGIVVNPRQLPTVFPLTRVSIVTAIRAKITNVAARAFIKESNITLIRKHKAGTITVTITGFGNDKVIEISGFKVDLWDEIANLQNFETTDVASDTLKELKANDNDVKDAFMAILGYPTKLYIDTKPKAADISIVKVVVQTAFNPNDWTIVFTITLAKAGAHVMNDSKNIKVTFTPSLAELQKLADKGVQALTNEVVGISNSEKLLLPSWIATKRLITSIWTNIRSIIDGEKVKALILEKHITLAHDDAAGTITVTIATGFGADKVLTISGFKKNPIDLQTEIDKVQDFNSTDEADNVNGHDLEELKANDTDVKDQFMLISDYASDGQLFTSQLTKGVTIAKVVVKIEFNIAIKTIVFEITLAKEGATAINNIKEITVRFA